MSNEKETEAPAKPQPIPAAVRGAVETARARISGQPGISVDRLLHQYGKTHMQLVFSEEQLTTAKQDAMSLEAQLKAALLKAAIQDAYAKTLEALLTDNGITIPGRENSKLASGLTPIRDIKLPTREGRPLVDEEFPEVQNSRGEDTKNSEGLRTATDSKAT